MIKISDYNLEWQSPVINHPVVSQHALGNGGHLIEIIAARIDHSQLRLAHVLGIVFRVAIGQPHVTLDREQIGEQPAGEHDDQSGVGEMNAEFAPRPAETFYMRGDEVDQQHGADEMAARKNRNVKSAPVRRPPHKHALEITLLRFVDPEMDLRQRARENQRHCRRQANDCQFQRCDQVKEFMQHVC